MTLLAFMDIGFGEMVVVAFVALLLFGGRLPEVMRTLGGSYRKLRRGMDDITRQTKQVLDVRPSLPPYAPTPPAAKPVPRPASTPAAPSVAAAVAPPSPAPVSVATPPTPSPSPTAAYDPSDDPPPV